MLTPIGNKILIKPVEVKTGTLILTNNKPTQFTIIAIGDEVTKVKPGQIVYLEKHYGTDLEHEKEKYIAITEDNILAKIE